MHRTCVGVSRGSYPSSLFFCADCVLFECKLPDLPNSEKAVDVASDLVRLRAARVASSSQGTYASSLHRFVKWGALVGLNARTLLPPGESEGVESCHYELFLAWAKDKYKYNTLLSTQTALVDWHKDKGIDTSAVNGKAARDLMKTIKREQGEFGCPVGKTGMTVDLLKLLLASLEVSSLRDTHRRDLYTRDRAWLALGFFGLLRRSEIIALKLSDLTFIDAPKAHLLLKIRRSKTDKRGEGASVVIAEIARGGVEVAKIVQAWLKIRASSAPSQEDNLFTVFREGHIINEPLRNGQALGSRLAIYLNEIKCKYPDLSISPKQYGMHSLRRGGVSAAYQAGISRDLLKGHGRWKSDAIDAYLSTSLDMKLSVSLA